MLFVQHFTRWVVDNLIPLKFYSLFLALFLHSTCYKPKPKTCCILKKIIFIFVFLLSAFFLKAQDTLPINYFRSPLEIPLYLSGSFGELRSNHFHSGIDIKTQGVEGHKIVAVADGFV